MISSSQGLQEIDEGPQWRWHAPNILLIPDTSSVAHLRENMAAVQLTLTRDTVARLDQIAGEIQPA